MSYGNKTIGDLFKEEPEQWGLRGDPYLWSEMRRHFSAAPMPSVLPELEQQIENAFLLLTGHPFSQQNEFFAEKFAHGGMSSGGICPKFWHETAMPLLKERFSKI